MAIRIDVVVVVIDRVDEKSHFIHFVGMLVGSKARGYYHAHKFFLS
jgi:hypothetical protein